MKKMLMLLLSAILLLTLALPAMATTPMIDGQIVTIKTEAPDLTGMTVILHSNDVHGALDGYAYMAALKKQYEAAGADVIVVDAGDFTQGNPYVSLSKGHSAIDLMNAYTCLGRITGEAVEDDLVEEIFSKFCMGK